MFGWPWEWLSPCSAPVGAALRGMLVAGCRMAAHPTACQNTCKTGSVWHRESLPPLGNLSQPLPSLALMAHVLGGVALQCLAPG